MNKEIEAIKQACSEKYAQNGKPFPKIAVVVCGKRHMTRFYVMDAEDADQRHYHNTPPGLVVDTGVTGEKSYDFFIQPHAALKGTVKKAI